MKRKPIVLDQRTAENIRQTQREIDRLRQLQEAILTTVINMCGDGGQYELLATDEGFILKPTGKENEDE